MVSFIDAHRDEHGVEPICQQLPIAPSTDYEQKAREADPSRLPERAVRDTQLCEEIERVWKENLGAYESERSGVSPSGRRSTWRGARWSG